ncbi:MAG: hypothetical protein JSU87_13175 [Gemmatimonadota bacterium]|nr:MAG: hypothetical protein JSU87_13175 [Gemmatimonadota bacterium]
MMAAWHSSRWVRLAVGLSVAVVVAGLGLWAQNPSLVGVNYDDGIYALLARAIAQGDGYRLTYLPVSIPGVKYPPLYPLSLVPFWELVGTQDAALNAMKLANGIYIGLAAGLFVLLLAELRILSLPLAAAAALVGYASGSMMLVSTGLLSEPLYLVIVPLALLAVDRAGERSSSARIIAAATLAGLAALTRTVGLALVAAALVAIWNRQGRRQFWLAAAVAALILAPWLAFTMISGREVPDYLVPHYGSYVQLYLSNLSETPLAAFSIIFTNVGAVLQTLGGKFFSGRPALVQSLAGASLLTLAVLGARRHYRSAPATVVYPWLYLGIVSAWSFPPFRFVFVLFPLLLALAAAGLIGLISSVGGWVGGTSAVWSRRRLAPAMLTVVLLLVFLGVPESRSLQQRVWDGSQYRKTVLGAEVIDWVRRNTDPSDVIAYEFDPLIALHTGRRAVPNNTEAVHQWYRSGPAPVEPLARLLLEMRVDYLAVRRDIPAAAQPIDALMGRYPGGLELLHVTEGGALIFKTDLRALSGDEFEGDAATTVERSND